MEARYVISPYDHVIRNISEREGNDWRLMSAIAYHESRFKADIVSRRGARGLMQIMPAVARQFDVASEEALLDPETNVLLANKVWNRIDSTLDLPAGISEKDRMSLILACYNGGIGHVNDARRLARVNGEDPNSWEVVLRYLELKSDPAYYQHEVVKCGKFTGYRQTRAFVQDVIVIISIAGSLNSDPEGAERVSPIAKQKSRESFPAFLLEIAAFTDCPLSSVRSEE